MPKMPTPIEDSEEIYAKVSVYEALADDSAESDGLSHPGDHRMSDLEYDESGYPLMPHDITAVPSKSLGQLYQAMESWYAYIVQIVTYADQSKITKKEVLDLVKEHVKEELRGQSRPKTEIESGVYKMDPRYIQANADYMAARFAAERIENRLKMISRRIQFISREVSRRSDEQKFSGMGGGLDSRDPFAKTGAGHGSGKRFA